jgi:hypothetical protein
MLLASRRIDEKCVCMYVYVCVGVYQNGWRTEREKERKREHFLVERGGV